MAMTTVDIKSDDFDLLEHAIRTAFHGKTARSWRAEGLDGDTSSDFRFSSSEEPGPGWHLLPTEMGADDALPIVRKWLDSAPRGPEIRDVDNVPGFQVCCEPYGQGSAFVAIRAVWIGYGT